MDISSIYPVAMVEEPEVVAAFFVDRFGFETTFTADWYVSLRRDDQELAFLRADHPTIPEGFRTPSTGLLLNIEVADAAEVHRQLVDREGLEERLTLRDEDFGQRHFIVEAPGRILVDVIENIPPSEEFAAAYSS